MDPISKKITYREALKIGLREALQKNENVFIMGEDVGKYGGTYAVTLGLIEEFGNERVRDTPLSEAAFVGMGIGASIGGMRPIIEIMTVNFALLALDQIINNAATLRHMSGGQIGVPIIIRMTTGAGKQVAAQHSHSFEGWFAHIPGIRIVAPATVEDARWMLAAALQKPDPVLIFEHVMLLNLEEEYELESKSVDLDSARVRKIGRDVSIITYGAGVQKALKAAAQLLNEGIDAEVIDLRTLRPLDTKTIFNSVKKTHRVVIVDEGWKSGSLSGEIMAQIIENVFYDLDAPLERVCAAEVPIPYPKHLEEAALPQVEGIVFAVKKTIGKKYG